MLFRSYVGANLAVMCDETAVAVCMDPQTSGGLLAAVDPSAVDGLVRAGFTVIGGFTAGTAGVTLA